MVEWIDWAGHWSNIIDYDTMGTDSFGDDVIILLIHMILLIICKMAII